LLIPIVHLLSLQVLHPLHALALLITLKILNLAKIAVIAPNGQAYRHHPRSIKTDDISVKARITIAALDTSVQTPK
jgi:hypothetical protein